MLVLDEIIVKQDVQTWQNIPIVIITIIVAVLVSWYHINIHFQTGYQEHRVLIHHWGPTLSLTSITICIFESIAIPFDNLLPVHRILMMIDPDKLTAIHIHSHDHIL